MQFILIENISLLMLYFIVNVIFCFPEAVDKILTKNEWPNE